MVVSMAVLVVFGTIAAWAAVFSFIVAAMTRNLSRQSHHVVLTDPGTGALVNVEVTGRITWSELAEPGEPVPTATWRSINGPPQQAFPARFLPEPSPLFLGPFQNASDILLALPQDAAYLVENYELAFHEMDRYNELPGRVTFLVNQLHGLIRVRCSFRASDPITAGAYFSWEAVRGIIEANIAANRTVAVTPEPNDLYQLAHQQRDVMVARMPAGGLRFEDVTRDLAHHMVLFGTPNPGRVRQPHQPDPQEKAEKLLKSWLSEAQLARYEKKGWFEVVGNVTGQRYRIHRGLTSNIELIDAAGEKTGRICVVPRGLSVAGDVMLAQKVALETDELGALKLANPDSGEGACFLVMVAKHGHKYAEHIKRISQTVGQP